jgi:hypothetical protein
MTDESHGMDPTDQPTPRPEEAASAGDEASVLEGAGDFTSGEGLVAFAGMVLILHWLIFGLVATDYWVSWLILIPAIGAALLPRVDRAKVERFHPLPLVMKGLGYFIALVGLLTIIEDLRFAGSDLDEAFEVIGALVAYAAFVMAFIGARQIKI